MRNFIATLNNMVFVPPQSVYRGKGQFDFFIADDDKLPDVAKQKFLEVDDQANVIFKKGGFNKKSQTELKKAGQPIGKGKDPKVKI
jgi:hypothetical protein